MCVMGLNQNKGQKILLRLRTDDLKVLIMPVECMGRWMERTGGRRMSFGSCRRRAHKYTIFALQGWRKILSIKKVLFHELAHNEHSEHDDDFYRLMRRVEREVVAFNSSGRSLGGGATGGMLMYARVCWDGYFENRSPMRSSVTV